MSVNVPGTLKRPSAASDADSRQFATNLEAESWTDWPNEAGFIGLEEHRGPIDLKVTGHIPSWAAGSLYRTGPGGGDLETDNRGTHHVSHWFDGFGHTHRFDIVPAPKDASEKEGHTSATVQYSSRRTAQAVRDEVKQKGWRAGITFAQRADPCVGIFSKMTSMFLKKDPPPNNNVVVERNFPGPLSAAGNDVKDEASCLTDTRNLFLLTDSGRLQEIDANTMENVNDQLSLHGLHPDLNGPMSCAHAQRDHATGDMFNFNLALGRVPTYRVFRTNAANDTTDILATIAAPTLPAAYIHSLFLTPNYVVLCAPSSHLSLNGLKVLLKQNIAEAIEPFDQSKEMQWVVVDRKGGAGVVASFSTPAAFFFHTINAFEQTDDSGKLSLIFDLVAYKDLSMIQSTYLDVLLDREGAARDFWITQDGRNRCQSALRRYRFTIPEGSSDPNPNATAELVFSIPAPHSSELPTINPARATLPYRYVYSAGSRGLSTLLDTLVKTDLETRDAVLWNPPRGHTPGEPIFVARPAEAGGTGDEDDGVLLSVVLDGTAGRSYLVVLDARTMGELGRADATFAIAIGTHGTHAPRL